MSNTQRPRYTGYFEDDDADAPRAVSRTASSAANPKRTAALGFGKGTLFKKTSGGDEKEEYTFTDPSHPHHAAGSGETAAIQPKKRFSKRKAEPGAAPAHPPQNKGRKVVKMELRVHIDKWYTDLHEALQESDKILKKNKEIHKHDTLLKLLKHRDAVIKIKKREDENFMRNNELELKENSAAYARKEKLPHPQLHRDRVMNLHGKEYETSEINTIANDVNAIVRHYRKTKETLTCPKPKPIHGSDTVYHIFPLIDYFAREKYRVIEALASHAIHAGSSRSPWEEELLTNSHHVQSIKKNIEEAKRTLIALRPKKLHGKPRKTRPQWDLPDKDELPPQVQIE